MRSREEIEKESNSATDIRFPENEFTQRKIIIELLLDMRDLVKGKNK